MNVLRHRASSASVLLALLVLAALRGAAGGEAPIVREITVRGYPGEPAAFRDLIQTKEGSRLDSAVLNEDLVRLFKLGYLATYQIQSVPGGVRIVFDIGEALRVRNIEIKGAGSSWGKKMKDEMLTRAGESISPDVLRVPEDQRYLGDKKRIRAYCQQRGYRAVTVVSETTRVPGTNQIDILFTVDLGPKYQVKWLRFEGNRSIPAGELRSRMVTKRDTLFTSRRYADAAFEDDIAGLQDYYRFKGFPNATVTYRRTFLGRHANLVDITIIVDEGQQYPTGKIEIRGNKAIGTDTILAAIPLKVGATYSDERLIESRQIAERLYLEAGYASVSVMPSRRLNAAGDAFEVTFEIDEGPRITVNTIRTRGNARTRREVILREMELEPGMVYDVRKLERSQRGLDRLQFFDSVVMRLVPTEPPEPTERDLLVDVTEGRTGMFRFGVGFSTTESIVGTIELTQRNFDWRDWPKSWSDLFSGNAFVGAGQTFRISLLPGTIYSNYAVGYENPYWKGRNQSFGWSVYYRSRDQGDWDESRVGLRLTRGIRKYKGDPDTDVIFHTRLEMVNVSMEDEKDAPPDAVDEKGSHPLFGAGVTVRRDRTDRPVLPTQGFEWELGTELVVPHGLTLGGGGTKFWTLGRHPRDYERVFSLRGRIDYELGSFPIYERLYAGGANLRGFAYRGAGPHQGDDSVGGKYRALLSAEYRYPIAAGTLYGVNFCDVGTVTDGFTLFASPRVTIGVGLRLLLPKLTQAPISLDLGFPIIKQSDDDTEILYFALSLNR